MRAALLLGALLVAGCSQTDADQPPPTADAAPVASQSTPAAAEASTEPGVTVTAESVILVGAVEGRGTSTTIAFGRPKAEVFAIMEAAGFVAPKTSANDECGAGPMEFAHYGPLELNFSDGKLAGWFVDDKLGAREIATDEGVSVGSPGADFIARHGAKPIEDSTLGTEYFADAGIGAFMSEGSKPPVVESLYAGTNCFFR